jgi:hypothetical protein
MGAIIYHKKIHIRVACFLKANGGKHKLSFHLGKLDIIRLLIDTFMVNIERFQPLD